MNLVKDKVKKKLRVAMKICAAFAGYNASAIFRRID
jgi:DNA-binding XRE family transcriptional regulator